MVVLHWPTQACYSSILKMTKREPMILKAYAKILTCPNNVNVKTDLKEEKKYRSHGMFSIKFVRASLSEDAVNIVISSWSKSTTGKYNAYIIQWMENRQRKNFILYNASLKDGIEFLTFLCQNGRE